jgi:hypothetical protein
VENFVDFGVELSAALAWVRRSLGNYVKLLFLIVSRNCLLYKYTVE